MAAVPTRFAQVILCFAGLFCQRTWQHAQLLLMGAVLVPGARTVASVLRVLGLAHEPHFVNFHRVLSRAVWSPRAAARVLLGLLVRAFVPDGPIVVVSHADLHFTAWFFSQCFTSQRVTAVRQ